MPTDDNNHKLLSSAFSSHSLIIHSSLPLLGAGTVGSTLAIGAGMISRTLALRPTLTPALALVLVLALALGPSTTAAIGLTTTARLAFHFFFFPGLQDLCKTSSVSEILVPIL
ncbi:hypothetical protein GMRT_21097 [Giardia muris]|uniref:Uncharacterized protein n=1 Tax=Giardia muris TaxID=5742 RepID=A0A4Z1SZV5_GIAMU|nr:hypothetical protein GMRT_21097 [Giardia muris]|eukprot:TNJ30275.1 hypothetical protein GMRT_21097 [Giardia muris]